MKASQVTIRTKVGPEVQKTQSKNLGRQLVGPRWACHIATSDVRIGRVGYIVTFTSAKIDLIHTQPVWARQQQKI